VQPGGEPTQGAQAAPVAAVAQLLMQPLGTADPLVPSLRLYEESILAARFGEGYEQYRRNVP